MRRVTVKVVANAPRSEVIGPMADGTLKVKVHAVAEKGRANDELVRVLAEHFGVSKSSITIVRGQTSTRKCVVISSET